MKIRSLAFGTALTLTIAGSSFQASSHESETEGENLTIVYAGTLIAVPGKQPLKDQTIFIENGKITKIENGFIRQDQLEGTRVIDLRDKFVLPGLIDSHVHLGMEFNPGIRLDAVTKRNGDIAYDALVHAQRKLAAGFTAVQDVGGPDEIFALRDAINVGKVDGPHIRAAGRAISPTAGHGDMHGYRQNVLDAFHRPNLCDGADDCRRATRAAIKKRADVVKITATSGVLSNTAAGTEQQFFDDELEVITQTVAKMGRKVTAHAHEKTGIDSALKAGVKSIEHGTYLDHETTALFKKYDAVFVPTILAGMTVVDWAKNKNWLRPHPRRKR